MSIPLILHTTPHHRLPVAVLLLWGLLLALPLQSTAAASSAPLAEPSADETSTDETSTGVAGTPLQRRPSFTHVDLPDDDSAQNHRMGWESSLRKLDKALDDD